MSGTDQNKFNNNKNKPVNKNQPISINDGQINSVNNTQQMGIQIITSVTLSIDEYNRLVNISNEHNQCIITLNQNYAELEILRNEKATHIARIGKLENENSEKI